MPSIAPPAHTRGKHSTDDWITPKWMIERLGPFDLDPCASEFQPWPCAARNITLADSCGLMSHWGGGEFVFCNPPYGKQASAWLEKMASHDNGIALVFARTETVMFFKHVWPKASALLFLRGRLTFHHPDGAASKAAHNSGGPSVLIGYGRKAKFRLADAGDIGAFVALH